MKLLQQLRAFCIQYGTDKTYWIAFSGGLDSHVLLALCNELRGDLHIDLRAVHINHGLSPNARQWSAHCSRVCAGYGIDYLERTIDIDRGTGDSLEAAAREKRYAVFAECLRAGDMLLTAHHQDDQAETVLLQLLRGAGIKGLAAMPVIRRFGPGLHGRPLLDFDRSMLLEYAVSRNLSWIDDESNDNQKFNRNFIRHEIMPLLKSRWPSAAVTLSRSAENCAEAQLLLDEFALAAQKNMAGSRENALSVSALLNCSPERQRLVLRDWIERLGYGAPDAKKMATILNTVLTAGWDRLPRVRWGDVELRRYRDDLFLVTCARQDLPQTIEWDISSPLLVPGLGAMRAVPVSGNGLRADIGAVSIRFRRGGEMVAMPGRGRRTLKNLLHEWNVLPWERDRVPLIYVAEELIGVTGYFLHADYTAKGNEHGYDIFLEKDSAEIPLPRKGVKYSLYTFTL